MTPFQAIRATIYMLLARAREPIGDGESIPTPAGADQQRSKAKPAERGHLRQAQMGRRRSDSPFHRLSSFQLFCGAVTEWVTHRHTGTMS